MAKDNFTPEERQMINDTYKRARLMVPVAWLILSWVAYALYNDKIDFGYYQVSH